MKICVKLVFRCRFFCFTLKGNALDSFSEHNLMKFSTKDSDNDVRSDKGWWYKDCYNADLNGLYLGAGQYSHAGMVWMTWQGYKVLKKTEVKIRPSQ